LGSNWASLRQSGSKAVAQKRALESEAEKLEAPPNLRWQRGDALVEDLAAAE
jgi:hypothetical protein